MNKDEYEKKLLREKIAAHRKVIEVELRHAKKELNPKRAAQSLLRKLAPKIASAIPVLVTLARRTSLSPVQLGIIAGVATAIPIVIELINHAKSGHDASSRD